MKRYLVFADGEVIEGKAFGAAHATVGELVFTTGMGGYVETASSPKILRAKAPRADTWCGNGANTPPTSAVK